MQYHPPAICPQSWTNDGWSVFLGATKGLIQDAASAFEWSVHTAAHQSRLRTAEIILHWNPYKHFDNDKCHTLSEFFIQGALHALFTVFY